MTATRPPQILRLTLQPNDVLPEQLNWKILDGFIRTATWDEEGEPITLEIGRAHV